MAISNVTIELGKIIRQGIPVGFHSTIANQIVKQIEQHPYPVKQLKKIISEDKTGLRNEARKYYNFIQQEGKILIKIKNAATHAYQFKHKVKEQEVISYYISLGQELNNFKNFLKNLEIKTQNFSDAIFIYMGEKPTQMVYGVEGGSNMENFSAKKLALFNVTPAQIFRLQGISSEQLQTRLIASKKILNELAADSNSGVSKFISNLTMEEAVNLQNVADEVARRFNTYRNTTHKILWTWGKGLSANTRKWNQYLLSAKGAGINVGDMTEAYIRCIVDRTYHLALIGVVNLNGSKELQYEFSTDAFMRSLDSNDDVSGFLDRDTLNIASKANKAQTMGITPALDVAYKILSLKEDDEDAIQNIIFEKFDELQAAGQVASHINYIVDKSVQYMLPY